MTDYELSASLNDEQVLAALRRTDANVDKLAKNGQLAFDRMSDGVTRIAKSLGVLTGVTTAVTNKLIEMGAAAIRTFAEITKGAIDSAKAMEVTEQSLIGIFQGNEKAATASLKRIREESIRLGVDLSELAPAFLPKVEDLDQFAKIGELVAGLARLDPAQGAAGARLALNEALSGDVTSLRRRFEIDVGPIKQAQTELGELEGLLVGLEQVLKSRGQDFESLSDTAAFTFGQTQTLAQDFQKTLGEPILDSLKDALREVNEFLIENKDAIDLLATVAGEAFGGIIDLLREIGSDGLEALDEDRLLQIADSIAIIGDAVESSFSLLIGQGETAGETLDTIADKATMTGEAMIKIFGQVRAVAEALGAFSAQLDILSGKNINPEDLIPGDIANNFRVAIEGRSLEGVEKPAQAYARVMEEVNKELEDFHQNSLDVGASNRELLATIREDTSAAEDLADAMLGGNQAAEDAAAAADEYADAQDKLNKARSEFDTDKARAEADLSLKQQRELLDAEIGFAQKREDLARKNAQAIEDIYRKNAQAIQDARTDLRRDEEDIARKNARSQVEIDREAAKKRVEIETDFRRELERIRNKFDFDAQEAIRANDAIAFLRIQRQKDFELQSANQQREEDIEDAESAAVDQRQKLQEQLQYQIEDARIANQRKLEDLRVNLEQSLQEQRIRYGREVQEAQIAEQRKREELRKTFQQQQQDAETYWNRRLQDLQQKYQREIEITQRYEAQLAQIRAAARRRAFSAASIEDRQRLQETAANNVGQPGRRGGRSGRPAEIGSGSGYTLPPPPNRRQLGGYTPANIDFLVGEAGPEIVRLPVSGNVIPNHRLKFDPAVSGAVTNNTINTRQTNFNLDAMLSVLSPQQIAIVQQLVTQLQMSLYE